MRFALPPRRPGSGSMTDAIKSINRRHREEKPGGFVKDQDTVKLDQDEKQYDRDQKLLEEFLRKRQ